MSCDFALIRKTLEFEEGKKSFAYKDHLGFDTIGIGFLVDERKGGQGLPDSVMNFWFVLILCALVSFFGVPTLKKNLLKE